MNWKGLRYFLHVARIGNISAAAQDLGIVQPALSRHIMRLEQDLGVELFVRAARGVELTAAGRLFLERGGRMMAEYEAAIEDLSALRKDPGGPVTFGILATLAQTFVPRIVRIVQERFPSISLRIIEGSTNTLKEAVLAGRAQAAIITEVGVEPRLKLTRIASELIAVFAPPGTRRPRPYYTLEELVATPLIASAGLHNIVDDLIRPRGVRLNVEVEVDSVEAVRRILTLGIGVSLQPVTALRDDVANGTIVAFPVTDAPLYRMLALAHAAVEVPLAAKEVMLVAKSEMTAAAAEGVFSMLPSSSV